MVALGGLGYLAQSLALPPEAGVQDTADVALSDLRDLEARMRHAEAGLKGLAGAELTTALNAYADLVARYEARAGYEADAGLTSPCTDSACRAWPGTDRSAHCRAVSGHGWRWPRPWRPSRSCCCWTSRPMIWTTMRWAGWRHTCGRVAARCSRSPMTGCSWNGSPPRSWRSARARCRVVATATTATLPPRPLSDGAVCRSTRTGARSWPATRGWPQRTWHGWTRSLASCRLPCSATAASAPAAVVTGRWSVSATRRSVSNG